MILKLNFVEGPFCSFNLVNSDSSFSTFEAVQSVLEEM